MSDAITADYLCQSLNIQDYFLGEKDPTMRLLLEKHLNECDECVAELISLQRLQALLRLAFGDPLALSRVRELATAAERSSH